MPSESSPVKLVTEAYLQSTATAESNAAGESAPPTSALSVLTAVTRVISVVLVCAAAGIVSLNVMTASATEKSAAAKKDRPTCGVDWLLWASGSNKTCESILTDKLEERRRHTEREFERRQQETNAKLKPFEIKEIDLKWLQWKK